MKKIHYRPIYENKKKSDIFDEVKCLRESETLSLF